MLSILRAVRLSARLSGARLQIAVPARLPTVHQESLRLCSAFAAGRNKNTSRRLPGIKNRDQWQLQDVLQDMNDQIQRIGRVYLRSVETAIRIAEQKGTITNVEVQLMLRAAGTLLREVPPADRSQLVEKIWSLGKKSELDVSHYNTLLHVKLENNDAFDPTEFLKEMSQAGIAPNRVTYQRFIQRFCEVGDVQNATKIIEFMKSQDLPISDRVFHSLIIGHARSGNIEAARNILDVMKSANIEPSTETFTVLAVELIERGDFKGAMEVLRQQPLSDEQVSRIIKQTALKCDIDALQEAVDLLQGVYYRFTAVVNTCIEVIVAKKLDAALLIFKRSQSFSPTRGNVSFIPTFMVKTGYPASEVRRVISELYPGEEGQSAFIAAARSGISSKNAQVAKDFIQELEKSGCPIKSHFFFPILCGTSTEAELLAELKEISAAGHQFNSYDIQTFIIARMEPAEPVDLLRKLVDVGIEKDAAALAIAIYLLNGDQMVKCKEFLKQNVPTRKIHLITQLAKATNKTNLPTAIAILEKLSSSELDVVPNYLEQLREDHDAAIREIAERKIPISSQGFNRLRELMAVDPLKGSVVETFFNRRQYRNLSTDSLETKLADAGNNGEDTAGILSNLLNAYCRDRDINKAEEVLSKIPEEALTPGNLASIIGLYTRNGKLESALNFYKKATDKGIVINPLKHIYLAELLVNEKRLPEAEEILAKLPSNNALEGEVYNNERHFSLLLLAIERNYGREAMFEVYDKYIAKQHGVRLLGAVIRSLVDDDVMTAYEIVKTIGERYRSMPYKKLVLRELIKADKLEEVQVISKLMTDLYGPMDASMELALCYVDCDHVDKAKELFRQYSGPRARGNIIKACNGYLNDNKIDSLKRLLNVLEEQGYEKDLVAFFSIKLCHAEDDVQGGLDVWTRAQEENVVLLQESIDLLAKLCKRNDTPVPFAMAENKTSFDSARLRKSKLLDLLDESVDAALSYRNEKLEKGEAVSMADTIALIHQLINSERPKEALEVILTSPELLKNDTTRSKVVIKRLLGVSAERGMVEEVERFYEATGKTRGRFAVQRAYMSADRMGEYVEKLEKTPSNEAAFFLTPSILKTDPTTAACFLKVGQRLANDVNDLRGLAQFWFHYIEAGQVDKAEDLTKQFPELPALLKTYPVPQALKSTFNYEVVQRVFRITECPAVRRKTVISSLFDLHDAGKTSEIEECLNFVKQNGLQIDALPPTLLQKLGLRSKDSESSSQTSDSGSLSTEEKIKAQLN